MHCVAWSAGRDVSSINRIQSLSLSAPLPALSAFSALPLPTKDADPAFERRMSVLWV